MSAGTDPLAALLVREQILPPPRVEEAQERQVLIGGTLDTALLELGYLDERRLLELLPRAYNARGVKRDELSHIDKTVTSLFPRRLAEKHGVVPLDVNGRRLTVAIAGPPDLALLDEIGFMLSVYVKPAVTTQARVAWALATHYGVPLQPRMEALLGRVGEDPGAVKAAVEAWQTNRPHKKPKPPTTPPMQVKDGPDHSGFQVAQNAGLPRGAPSAPKLEAIDGGSLAATTSAQVLGAADLEKEKINKRRRERVMWTVDDAIAELALAEDRDSMLEVVLRFGYRRLSTVAFFILTRAQHGHAFVGWDVIDPLLDRKDMAAFAMPADGKHALAQVYEMQSPFLGPLKGDDPLVRLFGRRARAVLLVPILVGERFLGVLYGDAGPRAIPPSSLAELHMVVPRLGKGLGNLILRKKKELRAAAAAPATPAADGAGKNGHDHGHGNDNSGAPHAAMPDIDFSDDDEVDIGVAAKAPLRPLPTIDIDIDMDEEVAAALADVPRRGGAALDADELEKSSFLALDAARTAAAAERAPAASSSKPDGAAALSAAALDAARAAAAAEVPPQLVVVDVDLDFGRGLDDSVESALADPAAAEAPAAAKEPPPQPKPPPIPKLSPWADGKDDDEDVRLDDIALLDLDGPVRPSPNVARIELGLDDSLDASDEGGAVDDDDDDDERAATEAELDELSQDELASIPDGAPVGGPLSIPDGEMPPPEEPSAEAPPEGRREEPPPEEPTAEAPPHEPPPSTAAGAGAEAPAAALRDGDDVVVAPRAELSVAPPSPASAAAESPGARARESMLIATHADWLAHDDPLLDDLVGQLHRPTEKERKAAVATVVAHGAQALPSLARYFPGVLSVHPFGSMESRPEVHELSDCLACLCRLGADMAAPILTGELGHDDRLHRWTATYALSALKVPGALPRLAQRVFDSEPSIAALALEVLDGYRDDEAFGKVLAQIRDLVRRGDPFERERAIMAVGELRDRQALLSLVDLIGTRPKEIADEARRALIDITKQDFGTAERRWRAFIADNDKTPRIRWLIDGLAAKDDDIRRSSQYELNRLTGQFFGYRWDAARADRDGAVAAWNEWLEQQPPGTWQ